MWKVMWKDLTTGWGTTLALWAAILVAAAVLGAVILAFEAIIGVDGDILVLIFLGATLLGGWMSSAKSRADRKKERGDA